MASAPACAAGLNTGSAEATADRHSKERVTVLADMVAAQEGYVEQTKRM